MLYPSGSSINDFGKLTPAEKKLLTHARSGKECVIASSRPDRISRQNKIRGSLIRFLALGGDTTNPVHANGIELKGAWIDCSDERDNSLNLYGIDLAPNLRIVHCVIDGYVDLIGANAGSISFQGTAVKRDFKGHSIHADRLVTRSGLLLRHGFSCTHSVSLIGASLGGDLDLGEAAIATIGPTSWGLIGDGLRVGGNVFLREHFTSGGSIRLIGARIDGDLDFDDSSIFPTALSGENDTYIDQPSAYLRGVFVGKDFLFNRSDLNYGGIDLSGATVNYIDDDISSWSRSGWSVLDGLKYNGFEYSKTKRNISYWKKWLGISLSPYTGGHFRPQPYEQLAKYLKSSGHDLESREIIIEKNRLLRQAKINSPTDYECPVSLWGRMSWYSGLVWDYFFEMAAGYGYRPWRSFLWLCALSFFGFIVYEIAGNKGVMAPSEPLLQLSSDIPENCKLNWVVSTGTIGDMQCRSAMPSEYASFNPLLYSIDVSVPIVNFGISDYWSPRSTRPGGEIDVLGMYVRSFYLLHVAMGWLLSFLFITSISGIFRRD